MHRAGSAFAAAATAHSLPPIKLQWMPLLVGTDMGRGNGVQINANCSQCHGNWYWLLPLHRFHPALAYFRR
eukprot:7958714-Karenia_brevis.AAC.1